VTQPTKKCYKCLIEQPFENFSKKQRWCKSCWKEYRREWVAKNKESHAEKMKEWYKANRESVIEHQKEYKEKNAEAVSERAKRYYLANQERIKEYRAGRKDITKERNRINYAKNADSRREYSKTWAKNNKHAAHLRQFKRRSEKFNCQIIDEDINIDTLLKKHNYICAICGEKIDCSLVFPDRFSPTIDHIIPISKNGPHSWANVQPAHLTCNCKKWHR
jgi:5-methylcytosine-specific restriction endonuclease McrA